MSDLSQRDVFVEHCIQREYLSRDAAQRCGNADAILPNIKHLMAYARWANVPVLTCIDAKSPATDVADRSSNGNGIRNGNGSGGGNGHTNGNGTSNRRNGNGRAAHNGNGNGFAARGGMPLRARVPGYTLMPGYELIESDNRLCISLDVLSDHHQAVFTKDHHDPFTNPKFDRLLTEMPAGRFVVFGMLLDFSLRLLVLGLIRRNRRVAIVEDACGFANEQQAGMVLRQLSVKGVELVQARELVRAAMDARRPKRGKPRRNRAN